ncbi:MAG: RNA methyltransferase, partial [Kiritimatiellae bacterium]|nr:RNA methyltransferase [Kiritimatiellia bacterium]
SLQKPRVKEVGRLRPRRYRDEANVLLIERYREVLRAIENQWNPHTLFYCRALFLGENEESLIRRCAAAGCEVFSCSEAVFRKLAYRDRPDGLLALAPQLHRTLDDLPLGETPFLLVAESIEKPGNLGTMLRSADAAGVDAVIVCDPCTDLNNPNVVRASIGTLFSVPVAAAPTPEVIAWLKKKGIQTLAATPHTDRHYDSVDLAIPLAIVVGSEQYGLHSQWMNEADLQVRIPMMGQADSLNVAAAATILLYETLRQRRKANSASPT